MNGPAISVQQQINGLPALVQKAAQNLASAATSAEVLEAHDMASIAYDAAKKAARMARAKKAHDDLIAVAHRAQNDALLIESMAKCRLADEYDAAQERGEIRTKADQNLLPGQKKVGVTELGMTHKQIHGARQIRNAEKVEPGGVEKIIQDAADRGEVVTRADIQRSVIAAAEQGLKGRGRSKRGRNPIYKPNPVVVDRLSKLSGLCRTIMEIPEIENVARWNGDARMAARVTGEVEDARAILRKYSEIRNA